MNALIRFIFVLSVIATVLPSLSLLRLVGLPYIPWALLVAYRLIDLTLVMYLLVFLHCRFSFRTGELVMLGLFCYGLGVGIIRNDLTRTLLNDISIYLAFMVKIFLIRNTIEAACAKYDLSKINWAALIRRYMLISAIICLFTLLAAVYNYGTGVQKYFQAPAEVSMAVALTAASGSSPGYLFFLVFSALSGKRMVFAGVLAVGIFAWKTIVHGIFTPRTLLFGGLAFVAVVFLLTLSEDPPFLDKFLSPMSRVISSLQAGASPESVLRSLDAARFAEYHSLKRYLSGVNLLSGHGFGFRYLLDSDYLAVYNPSNTKTFVTNAHFTPLGVVSKFGLIGMLLWYSFLFRIFFKSYKYNTLIHKIGRYGFICVLVQSVFAYVFFINVFTPIFVAMMSVKTQMSSEK